MRAAAGRKRRRGRRHGSPRRARRDTCVPGQARAMASVVAGPTDARLTPAARATASAAMRAETASTAFALVKTSQSIAAEVARAPRRAAADRRAGATRSRGTSEAIAPRRREPRHQLRPTPRHEHAPSAQRAGGRARRSRPDELPGAAGEEVGGHAAAQRFRIVAACPRRAGSRCRPAAPRTRAGAGRPTPARRGRRGGRCSRPRARPAARARR